MRALGSLPRSKRETVRQRISKPLLRSAAVRSIPPGRVDRLFSLGTLEKAATRKYLKLREPCVPTPRQSRPYSSDSLAHLRPQVLHRIASSSARGISMPRLLLTNIQGAWQRGQRIPRRQC